MGLQVVVKRDKATLERQIKALEYQLERDTREKDIQIHKEALSTLKQALSEL